MYLSPTKQLIYSPSDLVLAMKSPFASWMERFAIESPNSVADIERDEDPMMLLLAAKGNSHERVFLAQLQEQHGIDNVAIVIGKSADQRFAQTLKYMKEGIPFIYQAQLQRDGFAGNADFLFKVPGKSDLGEYHYEAWDTKLSSETQPHFLIQLCCYSWMLFTAQGVMPEEAVIKLGDFTEDRFRIARYYSFFDRIKRNFLNDQANFKADLIHMPDPAYYADYGRWTTYAKTLLKTSDSLALIAGIRKSHIKKLHLNDIKTLSEFALSNKTAIKGISQSTLLKLKAQAEIQHGSKGLDKPLFKVLHAGNGKDLTALPPASMGDLFFDIEGHPLLSGGLEYLWGVSYRDTNASQGKDYAFIDWWAHTGEQEKAAFEGFIDWAYKRWQDDPSAHIYHYASYEVTAMRKLSTRHDTRMKEVAELLANDVLIDLYTIVKNGLLIGESSYSIKKVENLYRGKRTTEVANGGDSVVFYESWRELGGVEQWCNANYGYQQWQASPFTFDWNRFPELNDIRDYNIDDCESTLELVDWLRNLQEQAGIVYAPKVKADQLGKEKTERQIQSGEKKQFLKDWQKRLIDRFEADESLKNDSQAKLMIDIIGFHLRERKPKIWAYYERLEKSDEALFDDDTCLVNVVIKSRVMADGGVKFTGHFDDKQPVRKDKFGTASLRASSDKIKEVTFNEAEAGTVEFIVNSVEGAEPLSDVITLFADEPYINTDTLERRLCEVTEALFDKTLPGSIAAILGRNNPVFKGEKVHLPINRERYPEDEEYLNAIIASVRDMDESSMCIQGPPGAGKTFQAKHVIAALVQDGKRVGILSNSHSAILNLLDSLHGITGNARIAKVGGFGGNQVEFRAKYDEDDYPNYSYRPSMSFTKKEPYESFSVVGATAYAFAGDVAFDSPLDYIFLDEASQTALANLIAIAGAATNIVLMGDQMQLEQPIQGSHPENAGASALEYLLGNNSVIPDSQGIFLERSYRMHPNVLLPLSEVVYEGKLKAAPRNERQAISIKGGKLIKQSNGLLVINVEHTGNRQSSEEEATVINALIEELKGGHFTDKSGEKRRITDDDILVVAPFNMQINLLKEQINSNCAIGTIDKFQGREAPVSIISMSVSDLEESARGIDFVFDINRLNVAVSRAKALAIIVVNPGLERCKVTSLKQMEKANFFCRLLDADAQASELLETHKSYIN